MIDAERNRLRWRCRRGRLELDLILNRFIVCDYDKLTAGEQQRFQELLALPDETLWAWISAAERPPNEDMEALVARLNA